MGASSVSTREKKGLPDGRFVHVARPGGVSAWGCGFRELAAESENFGKFYHQVVQRDKVFSAAL